MKQTFRILSGEQIWYVEADGVCVNEEYEGVTVLELNGNIVAVLPLTATIVALQSHTHYADQPT